MSQALERNIRAYIAEGSGLVKKAVKEGWYTGPIPEDTYATLQLILDATEGTPVEVLNRGDEPSAVSVGIFHRALFDVQFYRPGAVDAAEAFVAWGQTSMGMLYARSRGFTPQRNGQIRRLDDIVAKTWEERVSLDLEVTYWDERSYSADYIASVGLFHIQDGQAEETLEVSDGS